MAILSSLIVQLGLDSAQFRKGMKGAKGSLKDLTGAVGKMAGSMGKMGLGSAAAGATALGAVLITTQKNLATTAREAQNLGIAAESLQALGHAAQVMGLDLDTVADSAKDLSVKITDAALTGAGPMVDFFTQINGNAKEWAKLSPEKQLEKFSEELNKMPLDQARFYADEVNDSMFRLSGTMRANGGEFFKVAEAAKAAGLTLSDEALAAAVDSNKSFNTLSATLGALAKHLTAAMAPAMKGLADWLTTWVTETAKAEGGFSQLAVNMAKSILSGVRASLEALNAFTGQVSKAWGQVMAVFGQDPTTNAKQQIHDLMSDVQEWQAQIAGSSNLSVIDSLFGTGDTDANNAALQAKIDTAKSQIYDLQTFLKEQTESLAISPDLSFFDSMIEKLEATMQKTGELADVNTAVNKKIVKSNEDSAGEDDPRKKNLDDIKFSLGELGEGCEDPIVSFAGLSENVGASLEGVAGSMVAFGIGSQETMQKMFMAAKAYNVAQTIMSSFTAIQQAWASAPFPYNLPSVAAVTAGTLLNIVGVKGVTMTGAKAVGGHTNARSTYKVNEQGLEMFSANGQDYLMTGAQTGKITPAHKIGAASGSGPSVANMPISLSINTGGAADERTLARAMQRASKSLAKAVYIASQQGARNRGVAHA